MTKSLMVHLFAVEDATDALNELLVEIGEHVGVGYIDCVPA